MGRTKQTARVSTGGTSLVAQAATKEQRHSAYVSRGGKGRKWTRQKRKATPFSVGPAIEPAASASQIGASVPPASVLAPPPDETDQDGGCDARALVALGVFPSLEMAIAALDAQIEPIFLEFKRKARRRLLSLSHTRHIHAHTHRTRRRRARKPAETGGGGVIGPCRAR